MSAPSSDKSEATEPLPLSLLNDYLYCPRRAALKLVEGWREANEHTERGNVVHEHSDLPGYEVVKGVKLLRALPVFSERLGLNGKCDLVEVHALGPTGEAGGEAKTIGGLVPVEFKVGKRRKWENDDAQLCAQALCLEEMFGGSVPRGAVFHAESKRRRDVEFTPELRLRTEESAAALQALLHTPADAVLPAAVFKPGCEKCSLYDTCLPRLTGSPELVARAAAQLFKT